MSAQWMASRAGSLFHLQTQRGRPLISHHQSVLWASLQPFPASALTASALPCLSPYHLCPSLPQLPEQDLCSQARKGHHQPPTPTSCSLPPHSPSHPPFPPHPFTPSSPPVTPES